MSRHMKLVVPLLALALFTGVAQTYSTPRVFADASGNDGHGTVTVRVSVGSSESKGPHSLGSEGGGSGEVCVYEPAPPYVARAYGIGGPMPGEWLVVECPGSNYGQFSKGTVWMHVIWVTYAPTKADALEAGEAAASSIRLPTPVIRTDPAPAAVVNLSTWLWVAPASWHPWSATARVAGVSATATATPVRVEFSTGDGHGVSCNGPGTPYDAFEPASAQQTNCSHTYLTSSAGQPSSDGDPNNASYVIRATITWDVTWRALDAIGGGVLSPLTTSSSAKLRVEQIESLEGS